MLLCSDFLDRKRSHALNEMYEPSIGEVANQLDREQVEIITSLMRYHTRW